MKRRIVLGLATVSLSVVALCSFTTSKGTAVEAKKGPIYKNVVCYYIDPSGHYVQGSMCIAGTGLLCQSTNIVCGPADM